MEPINSGKANVQLAIYFVVLSNNSLRRTLSHQQITYLCTKINICLKIVVPKERSWLPLVSLP